VERILEFMKSDNLNIGVIATAIATVIMFISKVSQSVYKKVKDKINQNNLMDFVLNSNKASEECQRLVKRKGGYADRVFRFYAHNSGGKPNIGKPYYVSAIEGFYRDEDVENRTEDFKKLEVDNLYKSLVIDLIKNKEIEIIVQEMTDCMLKNIYEVEGLKYAKLYYLDISSTDFFYFSVGWYEEPDQEQQYEANILAQKLKLIYNPK
jgi:phosphopantetheine adenylyltransferase